MKRQNTVRVKVLDEIDKNLQTYCFGCFLYSHHKKDGGRTQAHQFCLSQCTVGKQLKELGDKLKDDHKP